MSCAGASRSGVFLSSSSIMYRLPINDLRNIYYFILHLYFSIFRFIFYTFVKNVRDHGHLLCGLSNSCHIWQSSAAAMRSSWDSVGDSFPFSISFSVVLDIPHFFDSLRSEYPLQFRISQIFMTIMQILCLTRNSMSLLNLWKIIKFMSIAIAKHSINMYNLDSISAKNKNGGNEK